jgi:DNA-binding GntR family transcriptional regulator
MLPWIIESSPDRLAAVRDTSLAKLVRDDLLAAILQGDLTPGQRINEPDVAARLQVSRVPVREALRELESSGLVVARKHSGVFVRQLDAGEIADLYKMRALLDGYAGRCVAQLSPEKRSNLLTRLSASVALMHQAVQGQDIQAYYAENLRFHWSIVVAAESATLTEIYQNLIQKLHLARLKNLAKDVGMQTSIAEHAEMIDALGSADPARCEAMLTQHVTDAYARLIT